MVARLGMGAGVLQRIRHHDSRGVHWRGGLPTQRVSFRADKTEAPGGVQRAIRSVGLRALSLRPLLGEIPAHVLAMVILGETGVVASGPLTVREIAWTLSPKYFRRHLAVARDTVGIQEGQQRVQAISGDEISFLGQIVVPVPETLDEFLHCLRDNDPITAEEQDDVLKSLP